MEVDVKVLVDEFYSKPFYLSYSGLNKLLYSPGLFYRWYVLQQQEDKLESYLIEGKVIHCMLLDDLSFSKHFILMPSALPGDSTRKAVDTVFKAYEVGKVNLVDYKNEMLNYLKEINLHQSLKDDLKANKDGKTLTGDEKRLEKVMTPDAVSYWEFLKIKGNKDLVDSDTMQICTEAVEAIRADSRARELLGLDVTEMDNIQIINEKMLYLETDKAFGVKGILDNVKLDHDKKIIYVNDLKRTSKPLGEFRDTIETYNYWAQASIYVRLVYFEYQELIAAGYTVVFHFVVIDRYNQVYCFAVSDETMATWQQRLEGKLNEANWHYENKSFKLPYEFAVGNIIL